MNVFEKKIINVLSVRFNTSIENMKHLGDRNSRTVFAHPSQFILVFTDGHAIEKKLKPSNTDVIDEIKSRIWEIKEGKSLYKELRQDSGRCNFSYARYLEKCFT